MTAWALLIANSSLESGTAWEHLNNQQGGTTYVNSFIPDNINIGIYENMNVASQASQPSYNIIQADNIIRVTVEEID